MHAWDRPHAGGPGSLADEITLRTARDEDFPDLLSMWRELMDLHVRLDPRFALSEDADERFEAYVDTAIHRDDYLVRLALLGHHPVGFSVSCILPNSPVYRAHWIGYVNDLCVTESVRGRGVGEVLVDDAVSWLTRSGAETVEVYVAHANEGARRFWRRMGGQEYLERLSLDLGKYPARRGR
ncbi:MAG: GNAT family N-acetyltransferase [Myxococcales bacterium]|nr:GNAT family N-acetyltransferase [Myxococcales bacterium]MCB9647322.1 GNAT family N-acetyltransferase [Deltaproteobacteria bacterium]